MPSELGNLDKLMQLWLQVQDNKFTGTFPSGIEDMPNLKELCLGNNDFSRTPPGDTKTEYTCT
jgi:Leucine-rich repeat (LRR) protein